MTLKNTQILTLAVVFALQYLFEHLYPQRREVNNWRNERFNLGIGLLNMVLTLLPASGFVWWLHFIQVHRLGLLQQVSLPLWIELGFTIIALDAWLYTWHRLNHTLPFLWRFHAFHHRDEKMNSTTALRFHIVEILLSYPGKALVCLLLGLEYVPVLIYEILFFASVVIHHSNIYITDKTDRLYRRLFVSPHLHRIHHSRRLRETHSNYGALFSFWDLLFRTRVNIPAGPVVFGVEET